MTLITLSEYARQHNRKPVSARAMAGRGRFATAQKVGKTWLIDSGEPYPDGRRLNERSSSIPTIPASKGASLAPFPINLNSGEQEWLLKYASRSCLTFTTGLVAYGLESKDDLTHTVQVAERPTLDMFLYPRSPSMYERHARGWDITVRSLQDLLERLRSGSWNVAELLFLPDDAIEYADALGTMILAARPRFVTVSTLDGLIVQVGALLESARKRHDAIALMQATLLLRCGHELADKGGMRLRRSQRERNELLRIREEGTLVFEQRLAHCERERIALLRRRDGQVHLDPKLSDGEYRRITRPILKQALALAQNQRVERVAS